MPALSACPPSLSDDLSGLTPQIVVEDSEKRADSYLSSFIRNALKELKQGNRSYMMELIQLFAKKEPDFNELTSWLRVINANIVLLTPLSGDLIECILDLYPFNGTQDFIQIYFEFCENLASAQSVYLQSIINMLLKHLSKTEKIPNCSISHVHDLLHATLKNILLLNPMANRVCLSIAQEMNPHKSEFLKRHVAYVKTLLRITDYAPSIGNAIWEAIIKHILDIDVEVQVEIEDLTDEQLCKISMTVFSNSTDADDLDNELYDGDKPVEESETKESDIKENADDDDDDDKESSDSDDESVCEPIVLSVTDMITKLDVMMLVVFRHLENQSESHINSVQKSQSKLTKCFGWLLNSFKTQILTTHRSRFTQFFIFYLLSKDKDLCDIFIQELLALHVSRPKDRGVVAAFLGSFAARASYLSRTQLMHILLNLSSFCNDYLERGGHMTLYIPNLQQHYDFYASAQAIFYIFCFRWKELIQLNADDVNEVGKDVGLPAQDFAKLFSWQHIISSKLNPLKVISSAIVEEFARLTNELNIVYCYSIIERNKSIVVPTTQKESSQLDAYFPFDPYRLKNSCRFIDEIFVSWGGNEEEDSDEEEENNEQPEEEALMEDQFVTMEIDTASL